MGHVAVLFLLTGASPCAGWLLATKPIQPAAAGSVRPAPPRSPTTRLRLAEPASGVCEGAKGEAEDAFMRWAAEQGIRAPKLRLAHFPPGYRGLAATTEIKEGERLVELPRSSTLCVGNRQPNPFPDFVGAAFWNQQSLHVRLALMLLFELRRTASGDSSLQPWLNMLPAHQDKPCRWTKAELDDLCDPLLAEEIAEQRGAIDAIHEHLVASSTGLAAQSVTLQEFRWAMDTVVSRTFGAQIPAAAAPGLWQTAALVLLSSWTRPFPRYTYIDIHRHT